ncbi:hypothetical protein REPUB_Repub05bG0123400 [Reevesia pubescens]
MERAEPVIRKLLEVLLNGLKVKEINKAREYTLMDDNGGLYVRRTTDDDDSWIHVPPIDGAFVINIGYILQIMSNDRYKSIEHRVVANESKNRVSVPIFVNPGADAVFGPLPERHFWTLDYKTIDVKNP